jgi:quinol monooxygenase YgiN
MYVVMFTLHAKPGHYAALADLYSAFAAGFLSSHPALESVLVVGDEASGVLRGVGIYTSKVDADRVNSDPEFAAFNDAIADMVAMPPERVELELLHLFARGS